MKLSIAIIRGCVLRPKQERDALFGLNSSDALGAAYEGKWGRITESEDKLFRTKTWTGYAEYYNRLCNNFMALKVEGRELMYEILTLNSTQTREEIAKILADRGL